MLWTKANVDLAYSDKEGSTCFPEKQQLFAPSIRTTGLFCTNWKWLMTERVMLLPLTFTYPAELNRYKSVAHMLWQGHSSAAVRKETQGRACRDVTFSRGLLKYLPLSRMYMAPNTVIADTRLQAYVWRHSGSKLAEVYRSQVSVPFISPRISLLHHRTVWLDFVKLQVFKLFSSRLFVILLIWRWMFLWVHNTRKRTLFSVKAKKFPESQGKFHRNSGIGNNTVFMATILNWLSRKSKFWIL